MEKSSRKSKKSTSKNNSKTTSTNESTQNNTQIIIDSNAYTDVTKIGVSNIGLNVTNILNALPSGKYYFPDGVYCVDGFTKSDWLGFKPKSNSTYIFSQNAKIKIIPNSSTSYAGIFLQSCDNTVLINPQVEGDRVQHNYSKVSSTHEWGHGIVVGGDCGKITIQNPYVYDCTGDGIDFICKNSKVTVTGIKIERCRRQGISIENCGYLLIDGGMIDNIGTTLNGIKGTSPKSGIDIEPYEVNQSLDEVIIRNIKTSNTAQGLLLVHLHYAPNYNIKIENSNFDGIVVNGIDGLYKNRKISGYMEGNGIVRMSNIIINGNNHVIRWSNAYVDMLINDLLISKPTLAIPSDLEGIFHFYPTSSGQLVGGLRILNASVINMGSEKSSVSLFNFGTYVPMVKKNIEINVIKSNVSHLLWSPTGNYVNCKLTVEGKEVQIK